MISSPSEMKKGNERGRNRGREANELEEDRWGQVFVEGKEEQELEK